MIVQQIWMQRCIWYAEVVIEILSHSDSEKQCLICQAYCVRTADDPNRRIEGGIFCDYLECLANKESDKVGGHSRSGLEVFQGTITGLTRTK